MKLFSEIYSTYYSITEKILKRHTVTKAEITDIIRQNGFSESVLFLEPKLTGADGYGLLKKEDSIYRSILKKEPHIPLTAMIFMTHNTYSIFVIYSRLSMTKSL